MRPADMLPKDMLEQFRRVQLYGQHDIASQPEQHPVPVEWVHGMNESHGAYQPIDPSFLCPSRV